MAERLVRHGGDERTDGAHRVLALDRDELVEDALREHRHHRTDRAGGVVGDATDVGPRRDGVEPVGQPRRRRAPLDQLERVRAERDDGCRRLAGSDVRADDHGVAGVGVPVLERVPLLDAQAVVDLARLVPPAEAFAGELLGRHRAPFLLDVVHRDAPADGRVRKPPPLDVVERATTGAVMVVAVLGAAAARVGVAPLLVDQRRVVPRAATIAHRAQNRGVDEARRRGVDQLRIFDRRQGRHQRAHMDGAQRERLVEHDLVAGQTAAAALGAGLELQPLARQELDRLVAVAAVYLLDLPVEVRRGLDQDGHVAERFLRGVELVGGPDDEVLLGDEQPPEGHLLERARLEILAGTDRRHLERHRPAGPIHGERRVENQPLFRVRGEPGQRGEVGDLVAVCLVVLGHPVPRRLNQWRAWHPVASEARRGGRQRPAPP